MMFSLQELLKIFESRDLLKKYHLKKVGVFGSILHSREPADIDLLIEDYYSHHDLVNFRKELEEVTGKSVDVVIEKHASPIIIHRAKKDIRYVA